MWPERLSLKIGKVLYNPIEHCCIMPGAVEISTILDQLEPLQAQLETLVKQIVEDEKNRDGVATQQLQELKEMKQANIILKKDLVTSQNESHDRENKLAELEKEMKEIENKWLEISKHFA